MYGCTNHTFAVKWEAVPAFGNPFQPLTFQLVLRADGSVEYVYKKVVSALLIHRRSPFLFLRRPTPRASLECVHSTPRSI